MKGVPVPRLWPLSGVQLRTEQVLLLGGLTGVLQLLEKGLLVLVLELRSVLDNLETGHRLANWPRGEFRQQLLK